MTSSLPPLDPTGGQLLAELAAAEKSRFWAAASHDLKQPLHALGLYTALLAKDPPAGERKELLGHINSCVASLTSLFDAILGVTHAENVHLHARSVSFPLQRVIDQVIVQMRPNAEHKQLRLRSVPTSAWVNADPAVIERVLGNLLSNAIRYTERGTVLVGVRRVEQGSACLLSVVDSGVGLAAHHQQRIFDDFFQVNNPERQRDKGYGLGLSTVHRLCSALGYDIRVKSSLGHGSVFAVRLPLAEPVSEGLPPEGDASPALGADLHVLFVDDDPLVRDAMRRVLTEWCSHVVMCSTGDEALSALSQGMDRNWHVLLDQRLADHETGLQVADRIRRVIGDGPTLTLITGEDDPEVMAGAAERGIPVLRKPLKPLRLRALLQWRQAGQGVR